MTDSAALVDDILSRKKPTTLTLPLCLDPEADEAEKVAAQRVAELERSLERLEARTNPPADRVLEVSQMLEEAEEDLRQARDTAEAATIRFVFRSIGRAQLAELVKLHPPTKEQRDRYRDDAKAEGKPPSEQVGPEWNPETFPPRLIAASLVAPAMTVDRAVAMWSDPAWNHRELDSLFTAAWNVNHLLALRS